jgi:hypothetical protein
MLNRSGSFGTPEFGESRRERKVKMVFAHLKRINGLGRLRLRGRISSVERRLRMR